MSEREAPWWLKAVGCFFAYRALSPFIVPTLLIGGLWLLASAGWDSFVERWDHGGTLDRNLVPAEKVVVSVDHDQWAVENHGAFPVGRVVVSCRDQYDGEYDRYVPEVVRSGGSITWYQPSNLDAQSMACRVSEYAVFRR